MCVCEGCVCVGGGMFGCSKNVLDIRCVLFLCRKDILIPIIIRERRVYTELTNTYLIYTSVSNLSPQ